MERVPQTDRLSGGQPHALGKLQAWVFLCLVAAAFAASLVFFDRAPITVAVFRGGDAPQAFKVSLFLNGREPLVSGFDLTVSQRHELARSILTKDDVSLRGLSRMVGAEGRYVASASGAVSSLDWPSFFGGGVSSLARSDSEAWVCSLTFPEKAVLAFWSKTPPPAPWSTVALQEVPQDAPAGIGSTTRRETPLRAKTSPIPIATPLAEGTERTIATATEPLKVEIRNGCGITNAADAVARAAKDAGMQVVFVGNAEGPGRFKVQKTFIESRVGVPVALEEFCKRLGIAPGEVREKLTLPEGVDVVVTVGRDYLKIRERLRARTTR